MTIQVKSIPVTEKAGLSKLVTQHIASLGDVKKIAGDIERNCDLRNNFPHRNVLVKALKQQYAQSGITLDGKVKESMDALINVNAFTITTGHQLCVFSGPLYVIHKIVTAVKVCKEMNAQMPEKHFVPVYWMATEDHDIEEISSIQVFRDKWTVLFSETGPTGNLNSGDVLQGLQQLTEIAGTLPHAAEIQQLITECYANGVELKHAHRKFIHALFAHLGVVIIDGDDAALKNIFSPVLQEELQQQIAFKKVEIQNKKITDQGFSPQVNARDINLFLIDKHSRERIEKTATGFITVDSKKEFTTEEMLKIAVDEPQRLSPNVILRPLYQSMILPDVGFVGGPAETAYWMQFDELFAHFNVPMPLRMGRYFVFYANEKQLNLLQELEKKGAGMFDGLHEWSAAWVKHQEGFISFDTEKTQLENWFDELNNKAVQVDKSLQGFVASEKARTQKFMESLNEKTVRALKKKSEDELAGLNQLHAKFFPNGSWMERHESALPYLWKYGKTFIDDLVNALPSSLQHVHVLTR